MDPDLNAPIGQVAKKSYLTSCHDLTKKLIASPLTVDQLEVHQFLLD